MRSLHESSVSTTNEWSVLAYGPAAMNSGTLRLVPLPCRFVYEEVIP
jgi:hypothetical protein